MPNKTKHRSRTTSRSGKNNSQRSKLKGRLHPHGLSGRSRRRRTNDSATGNDHANFLNPKIKPIKLNIGREGSFFDSDAYPQEQLHFVISNLFHCLKNTPGFKDDKKWDKLPSLPELADYLVSKTKAIHGDAYSYKFIEDKLHFYTYQEIGKLTKTHCLPLEWLPILEKKISVTQYRNILCMLGMIADKWHLDVILNNYNDMVIFDTDAYLCGEEERDQLVLKHTEKYKKNGPAALFAQELKSKAKSITKKTLVSSIRRYKAKNSEENIINEWLLKGIEALNNSVSIGHFHFPSAFEEYDSDPVNANDMFCYAWSFHDKVNEHVDSWLDDVAQNSGLVGPTIRTEYFPNRPPKKSADIEPLIKLAQFLEFGRGIYWRGYNQELKDQYEQEEQTLIEIYA